MFEGKKAFIFDFDGTLAETLDMWDEIDAITSYQIASPIMKSILDADDSWKENIYRFRTESLRRHKDGDMYQEYAKDLILRYCSNMGVEEVDSLRNENAKLFMRDKVWLKPYAGAFIRYLKEQGYYLILATVGSKWCIDLYASENQNIKNEFDLYDIFDLVLTKDEVTRKKPDPEVYLKATELSGYKKEECIVFEDSLEGLESAKKAGIETVCMHEKHALKDIDQIKQLTNYYYSSFKEVMEAMKPKVKTIK